MKTINKIVEIIIGLVATAILAVILAGIFQCAFIKECKAQEPPPVFDCYVFPCEKTADEKKIDYSWSGSQIALQGALSTLSYIDMRQTIQGQRLPGNIEYNPMLGKYPSDRNIKNYFLASQIAELAIVEYFPEYRTRLLALGVTWEAAIVGHNKHVGLAIKF